ncbi:DUF5327 family protein [Halalkalibacter alkalisediminis]|uniref:DUF5327 family protein n=1 Tax=Halalkalibacter alkalisediminis TaxID=935616 RepID=A0ABV6NK65_9BACI|nr:DUF5327 family protein [Halalkalibacter alkalisediminis]
MDIPAKAICDQLEGQMEKLKIAISQEDRQSVAERVAVIEAYCQLLKSPSNNEGAKPTQETFTPVAKRDYQVQTETVQSVEQDVRGRNLLDF